VSPGARKFLSKLFQKDPDRRPSAKDILMDGWSEITASELEMLSPKHALGFANNSDIIHYEQRTAS
jgi:serine/threonine protein kinase